MTPHSNVISDADAAMIRRECRSKSARGAFGLALAAIVLGAATSGSGTARAQPPTASEQAPRASDVCAELDPSAMASVGCRIGRDLGTVPNGVLVASTTVASDVRIDKPFELAARVVFAVARALGPGARSAAQPMDLWRARGQAPHGLVFLHTEVVRGELRVTADLHRAQGGFWQRVRDPSPAPRAHAFASARIDAEVGSFMPPIPLVARRIDKAKSLDRDIVALACADIDRDGSLELVLVGRRRVALARSRRGRIVEHASKLWSDLSPVAPTPLREPLASVFVNEGRFIDVGLSDRAHALRFDPSLGTSSKLARVLPWPSGGCSELRGLAAEGRATPCTAADAPAALPHFQEPADALAGARVVSRDGASHAYHAARAASDSAVVLREHGKRSVRIASAGAQLALADLDLDGRPEIVTSTDTLERRSDAVVVRTLQDDGSLGERMRIAVPSGVRALAVCPAEGAEMRAIVVATSDEVWVVR